MTFIECINEIFCNKFIQLQTKNRTKIRGLCQSSQKKRIKALCSGATMPQIDKSNLSLCVWDKIDLCLTQ